MLLEPIQVSSGTGSFLLSLQSKNVPAPFPDLGIAPRAGWPELPVQAGLKGERIGSSNHLTGGLVRIRPIRQLWADFGASWNVVKIEP